MLLKGKQKDVCQESPDSLAFERNGNTNNTKLACQETNK